MVGARVPRTYHGRGDRLFGTVPVDHGPRRATPDRLRPGPVGRPAAPGAGGSRRLTTALRNPPTSQPGALGPGDPRGEGPRRPARGARPREPGPVVPTGCRARPIPPGPGPA